MSRMTAAQVITLGEYLEPEFDPSTLTVSQLLGVLGYHNIAFPTPYNKLKLVQVFNNEVKSRATKFKKERLKKENSIASEEGITDGITGQPLSKKGKAPAPGARRSSRRLSQVPKVEEDSSPPRPEPSKRRRSSAQPALGSGSKRMSLAQPQNALIEESEPEEDFPVKKVGRTKKLSSAGQSRRVSHLSGAEDSGWEDNNIFQSGAESSSPARPSPVRPRVSRGAVGPRISRKSTSAPPQMVDSSSPLRPSNTLDYAAHSPPQSPFRPSLPPIPTFDFSKLPKSRFTPIREFTPAEPIKVETEAETGKTQSEHVSPETSGPSRLKVEDAKVEDSGLESQQDSEGQIDEAIAQIEAEGLDQVESYTPTESFYHPTHWLLRGLVWTAFLTSLFGVYSYKAESASIGYCERGSNTSQALETIFAKRVEEHICRMKLLELQNSTDHKHAAAKLDCELPPLLPITRPSSCTTCPDHATCSQFDVACDSGFLLKPHIFLSFIPVLPSNTALTTGYLPQLSETFFKTFMTLLDGLPGFGSIALPPRCVEDPQRKRHIGALGKAIESQLAKERGKRVCRGDHINASESLEGYEAAKKWGVEEAQLKEHFKSRATPKTLAHFDDLFNKAIQQLTQWGGVFIGESTDGTRYIAHKTPEMSWQCVLTVKSREAWEAWRTTVLASILSVLIILGMRIRMTQKQKENKRIAGLVQVALDTLRNQEMAHYTDPLTAPEPYLSSIQLRDLVLQDEHSLPTRRRLWERVERVVESNANVRANLEELQGGDETRVWRWVGSSGRTPGRRDKDRELKDVI
ncbi:Man1-Src1p-C-terminal domain-containing protein [Gymnopilus junonius]|uniref:Man1-Src1p-C-terminal domain-containing protein n=1 Tax=Gymnopilus junonius TaxID=109634 RepID=A0A9P5TN25_GYMJU|nr:Man1-Src1p-C-terminal domain-containing protein [Gymnopilus junonius]